MSSDIDDLLSEAERLKILGNSSFASGKFIHAKDLYCRGVDLLNDSLEDKDGRSLLDMPPQYRQTHIVQLYLALSSNKALAMHKLGQNEDVVRLCSQILDNKVLHGNMENKAKIKCKSYSHTHKSFEFS